VSFGQKSPDSAARHYVGYRTDFNAKFHEHGDFENSDDGGAAMPDDKTKFKPADPQRINVKDDYEFRYWLKELNCTPNDLRDAVKAVGVSLEAVKQRLAQPARDRTQGAGSPVTRR
jgi:hypothetical protein